MRRSLVALVALAVLAAPSVVAAARCEQTTIVDLEDEVMCPVCAMPLGLAREAPQARRERAFIAGLIESCRSKDEIKDALVAEFGPAVLAEPAAGGFSASAYVVPLVTGAGILGGVALAFARWRRRTGPGRPPERSVAALGDAERRALEAELDRMR
jgi:cytochrome c-type biogenesis protein CcmH